MLLGKRATRAKSN